MRSPILAVVGLSSLLGLSSLGCKPTEAMPEPAPEIPRVEGRVLVVTDAFLRRAGVKVAVAEKVRLIPHERVVGTVTYDPKHVAVIDAKSAGFVRRVLKFEGAVVEVGQALAVIESEGLREAVADAEVARAYRRAAAKNADRERDLLTRGLTTAREVELAAATLEEQATRLRAAQARVESLSGGRVRGGAQYELRTPIAGSIVTRGISQGMTIGPNVLAFRVANLDHLWVELSVSERRVGQLRVGDGATLTTQADGAAPIEGRIAYVGEVIEEHTRTADVRVEVDNRSRSLRPGQSVVASLRLMHAAEDALAVPRTAVTFVDGRATVFVAESPTRLVASPVVLGATDGLSTEIVEGLAPGVSVVTEGVLAVKSEFFR